MSNGRTDGVLSEKSLKFLDDVHQMIIIDALSERLRRDNKVTHYLPPEQLKKELDLQIGSEGAEDDLLLSVCKKVIQYSVPIGHPHNFNLLISGINDKSLAGSWITDSLNANIHTYESAPAFIIIENYIIEQLNQLIGYQNGDGIFVPGSSFGNMMAIHLARYKFMGRDINKTGLFGLPRLTIFCSTHAHYSVMKAAMFLGFGTDSIRYVKTEDGRMVLEDLENQIQESKKLGEVPLIVIGTSGTTVLGSFDDLAGISDICSRHKIWLHSDAAWGGGALFSSKRSELLGGIEKCDSVVWSLHKLIGAQLQCAVILTKQRGLLEECNSNHATYLFNKDKFYDTTYDVGDKTVQCGRKVDAFKLWTMWKSLGHQGMIQRVDRALLAARYVADKLQSKPGFRLVKPSFQFLNISFWYIPEKLRGKDETEEWWRELGTIAPRIKEGMMLAGSTLIAYQPLASDNLVNFFRIIVSNPSADFSDFDFVLDELDRLGRKL